MQLTINCSRSCSSFSIRCHWACTGWASSAMMRAMPRNTNIWRISLVGCELLMPCQESSEASNRRPWSRIRSIGQIHATASQHSAFSKWNYLLMTWSWWARWTRMERMTQSFNYNYTLKRNYTIQKFLRKKLFTYGTNESRWEIFCTAAVKMTTNMIIVYTRGSFEKSSKDPPSAIIGPDMNLSAWQF